MNNIDPQAASQILINELSKLRAMTYHKLGEFFQSPSHHEIAGPSGIHCQIEFQAFWDDPRKPEENLRVIVSIDNGGLTPSHKTIRLDFIISPTGDPIDEQAPTHLILRFSSPRIRHRRSVGVDTDLSTIAPKYRRREHVDDVWFR